MEFARSQVLQLQQKEAVRRLRHVLTRQGFKATEIDVSEAAKEEEGQANGPRTLVFAFCQQLAPRALEVVAEAYLLLTSAFLVHPSGEASKIEMLAPEIRSLVPEREELQSVVEEMQSRVDRVFDEVAQAQNENPAEASADRVKKRLYEVILSGIDAVSQGDLAQSSEDVFTLAKAYAAVASLDRAEEVELHLE